MADTTIKNKLVLKDLGKPALVTAMEGEKAKHVLGTILGIASSVRRRANRVDPTKTDDALVGDFEGTPADATADITRSGLLYLPDGMFAMIASKLEGEDAVSSVQFAIEVATVKANNPLGYTWAFTPKLATAQADPLEALRSQVVAQKAVTDQSKPAAAKK